MLPNFLIIGAGRSGTSWLASNLRPHPEVFVPRVKEVHFFDRHYDRGIDWYRAIFQGRTESSVGEATPAYLYHERVCRLIHHHMPEIKLVAILRNPMERAYSHYLYLVAQAMPGQLNYTISFEEKLRLTPRLIDTGMYMKKLQGYLELFPLENILILLYDDLKDDPVDFLENVYTFLNVERTFVSPLVKQKVNAVSAMLGRPKVLHDLYRVSKRFGLHKVCNYLAEVKQEKLPEMHLETKQMLLDNFYLSEILELEKFLNRDLSAWKSI